MDWQYSDIRKKAWNSLTEGSAINAVLATLIFSIIISVPLTIVIMGSMFIFLASGIVYFLPQDFQQIDMDGVMSGGLIVYIGLIIFLLLLLVLFGIFVIAPLTVGYNRYLINMVRKNPNNGFGAIFYAFKKGRYMTQVAGMFIKDLRLTLWSLAGYGVLYTPIIFFAVIPSVLESNHFGSSRIFSVGISVLFITFLFIAPIISTAWLIRCAYAYRFTEFILAEHEGLQMTQAVNLSTRLTKGIKLRMFFLNFTFLGWYFLNSLTSGLLMYWIIPYVTTAYYKVYCIQKAKYPELFDGMRPSGDNMDVSHFDAVEESVTI